MTTRHQNEISVNGTVTPLDRNDLPRTNGINKATNAGDGTTSYVQSPVAVISMACRVPDQCHTPRQFWDFIAGGKIAGIIPPPTRFSLSTHYDGSLGPQRMASPGGMFLQNVDPRDIDAKFFRLSGNDASSMDPQQRQLLEVVYEGLENAGVTLDQLHGQPVGCFVSSFTCDYGDIQARDPGNRASNTVIGVGRAILSNRLSHFLKTRGPSITVDTACSGALIAIDLACRYLTTGDISSAIVAGASIYCSPEQVMERLIDGAASITGRCHTFDAKADGYIKAEAVNMVYLKRLEDAIKDKDPIRAIIRGTANNNNGWTAGIVSPNPEAQIQVIRRAYRNAGIDDLFQTGYVECHGTGTRAGDLAETSAVAAVFCPNRKPENALRIGSVKSNIGHSEPSAGFSGLMKAIISLETGIIPGNPTFIDPSPRIDFEKLCVRPSRTNTQWPAVAVRRVSVNSFGYGGSNAHLIVDEAKELGQYHVSSYRDADRLPAETQETSKRPYLLVLSADQEKSLNRQLAELDRHLSDPAVSIKLRDLAYTLGERRSRHYHRGFCIASAPEIDTRAFERGHTLTGEEAPHLGLIFTGQGAQWPEMGKGLLETFSIAAHTVKRLDKVLQSAHDSPPWTLYDELTQPRTPEHYRSPQFSQPLVTALQLAILSIFNEAGLSCRASVGHSSGEIAAAVAAGLLCPDQAIKIAYYRGMATSSAVFEEPMGMMAVGLGAQSVQPYVGGSSIQIACVNSPEGVTLSGTKSELCEIEQKLKADGHFVRLLVVDAPYHSRHMQQVAGKYQQLLEKHVEWERHETNDSILACAMCSSTTGKTLSRKEAQDPAYWVENMVSPVLFSQAATDMIPKVNYLVEIGPSNALSGPVSQIKKAAFSSVEYASAWKRGSGATAVHNLLQAAGKLFTAGFPIKLSPFNRDDQEASGKAPVFISDLPNYVWDHSIKYWHESEASSDWRFRKFLHHDLLGSQMLGTPWAQPMWKNVLDVGDSSWLRDHRLGDNVVFPAAAYMAVAAEAIYQKSKATGKIPQEVASNQLTYKLRNVSFQRVLNLDEHAGNKIVTTLHPCASTKESWHEFTISSISHDGTATLQEHSRGLVSLGSGDEYREPATDSEVAPLVHPLSATALYKRMGEVGYHFGPAFRRILKVEIKPNHSRGRAFMMLDPPASNAKQSSYTMHPVAIDGCLQVVPLAALGRGQFSNTNILLAPTLVGDVVMHPQEVGESGGSSGNCIITTEAKWSGVGNPDDPKSLACSLRAFSEQSKELLIEMQGLRYNPVNATADRPHAFTQVVWAPDFEFLSPEQMAVELNDKGSSSSSSCDGKEEENPAVECMAKLASLIVHKRPSAKILEVALDEGLGESAGRSLWLDGVRERAGQIAAGCAYEISTPSEKARAEVGERYSAEENLKISAHEAGSIFEALRDKHEQEQDGFDLVICRVSDSVESDHVKQVLDHCRPVLARKAYAILVRGNGAPGAVSFSVAGLDAIPTMKATKSLSIIYVGVKRNDHDPEEPKAADEKGNNQIHLVRFQSPEAYQEGYIDPIRLLLAERGWDMKDHFHSAVGGLPDESTVLVLDEMFTPIISSLGDSQFLAFRQLLEKNCRVLWVTKGSQMNVTDPELGLIYGVSRSLLSEYPTNFFACLDVESNKTASSLGAIDTALRHLRLAVLESRTLSREDNEFVERSGVLHISRVVADIPINKAYKAHEGGAELRNGTIRDHDSVIRLTTTHPGVLDRLEYAEFPEDIPLQDDEVEVDVRAGGMNFKDMANAMGLIPADEQRFGLDCAGIITQVGKDIKDMKRGDRVILSRRDGGCFANRARGEWSAVVHLDASMSFLQGATASTCYRTAYIGLITQANLQKGQSVLIHSASGGVGLAAIQICQYLGAEIYVTVGAQHKRDFLAEHYGIRRDRMFTSRSTNFAPQLMKATNGRGVDVCLNSLTGDLLHESWRCIADNGHLIEIGKKDILDRNSLSMEPFDRNCSYHALDLSHRSFDKVLMRESSLEILKLYRSGHIKPLYTCKVFPFEQIQEAFRYMQQGKHIGKVGISFENSDTTTVPYRPAPPRLRLREDASYLIVGGFKGLCGSIALYLAQEGAKNIVIMSRSGCADEVSQKIIYDCDSMGCHVDVAQGDVTNVDHVRRAFREASKPVAGVIQGAMVLRDRMITSMTPDEFRDPIKPKVIGTLNLHAVSMEQSRPLDFFTMLSSISGIVGQLGQANYAAGNVFLDAFANYRLRQGLPACSIDLGPVEGVGYLDSKDTLASRMFGLRGWIAIDTALLQRIIRHSIMQQMDGTNPDHAGQLVTSIMPGKPPFDPVHRFSALRPAAGSSATSLDSASNRSSAAKLAMLKNAAISGKNKETLLAVALEQVNAAMMRSLGTTEPLEPTRPLSNYGVDSMNAVELRNWVKIELGIELTVLEIIAAKTLTALCETILKKLMA